ncbi:TonB-dependent receptor [uncultured Draconibacterium sp.]|uniref:SusC/RagA family TonB-linked outer membrane protein n=1 Tax=uncultured Draconibacterium sp. TaxID=1573823 RepID=UPI0025E5D1EA|nr:TonB-dependent receptor [uncultured Draconibacterium sp.]
MKRLLGITLAVAFMLCLGNLVWAQKRTVTGSVNDQDGISLPGVTVIEKGTTNGTVTDVDGNFSISVSADAEALQFSFVGMKLQEVVLGTASTYNVTMEQDAIGIEEVVAIGYGSMKKSDLTGAVASVASEDIIRVTPTQAAKAIQGQVAGVTVKKSSGRPGAGYDLNIRGLNSINYDNSPLVVIDGVMGGDINVLNPSDIETMDVLKDASATAIYGSRGANGVIIITTKRGSKGEPQVTYNGYAGVKVPAHLPDMMNAQEFYEMAAIDKVLNGGTSRSFSSTEIDNYESGRSVDWIDEVTDPSLQTNHSVSVAGGGDNTNYHFSTGYLKEGGSLKNTKYERYNIKGSLDSELNDVVKVGFNANYSFGKQNLGSNEAIRSAFRARPTGVIMYDDILNPDENQDTDWNGYAAWMGINDKQVLNPLIEMDPENFQDETRSNTFFGNAYIELTPLKGLSIRSQLSANVYNERFGQYRGTYTKSQKTTRAPRAYYNTKQISNYTLDNIVTYKTSAGEHDFTLTGVQSAFQTRTESMESQVDDLPYNSLWYAIGTGETISKLTTNLTERSLLSFMGRIIYGFKDKYLVTLTNRWDGASQLSDGNKWDFFPSAAVAWRVSDEPFMESVENISSLKMRVSYGLVGNSAVSAYSTQASLTNTAYDFDGTAAYGFAPANLADKSLKWEKSKEINLGIDLGLMDNRITTSIELYKRNTVDLIYDEQIPNSTGFSEVTTNIGEVQNKGIEIMLNTVNIKTDRFSWTTNLTFSTNKNEVVSIGSDGILQDISTGLFVGEALDVHYGYEFDGIWQLDEADAAAVYGQVPGAVRVVDQNNDDQISTGTDIDDRIILGSEQAKWIGGMTNKFTFDNFDLSFLVYTSQGAMYRNSMLSGTMGDVNGTRYNVLNLNYWTINNPSNEYYGPGVSNPYRSAIQYQDASFIRISDITLGYTLPKTLLDRWHMSHVRLYAQVTNPFVFHDFDGTDPEYNTSLYNDDVSSATYLFGVKVTF